MDNISWPLLTVRAHGEYNYRVKIQFRSTQETQFHNYPYIAPTLIGQPQPESINVRLMVGMSKRNPALVKDIERPFCVTVNIFST